MAKTEAEFFMEIRRGVYRYPEGLSAMLSEAAKVMGMDECHVPAKACEFVAEQATACAHREVNCFHGNYFKAGSEPKPMLVAWNCYKHFATEILAIVGATHSFYDL